MKLIRKLRGKLFQSISVWLAPFQVLIKHGGQWLLA